MKVKPLHQCIEDAESCERILPNEFVSGDQNQEGGQEELPFREVSGKRRYLVLEFPHFSLEEQAALHSFLDLKLPLVLLVRSESTAFQGWYSILVKSEKVIREFEEVVISLGVNRNTLGPLYPVKMPGGIAGNGFEQTIEFFNPGYGGLYR